MLATGLSVGATLLPGPAVLAGCTLPAPQQPEGPDPLESPARRAASDAELARAVAGGYPALASAAGALARDRQAHATALQAELRRVHRGPVPSSSAPPPAPTLPPADQAAARDRLAGALRAAQDEAGRLVGALPGYRAALLASVAACCASHLAVLP